MISLQVAGGFYREWCLEGPGGRPWDELFGSGLRAAAAVARWGCEIALSTYIADGEQNSLQAICGAYGVEARYTLRRDPVCFVYDHPLSTPSLDPHWQALSQEPPFVVKGDAVVRFGMVEGTAVVHADRVVYDPQAAWAPEPFAVNGSTAGQLVVVANLREARLLTGLVDAESAGQALRIAGATACVVKRGIHGAIIVDEHGTALIPAYRTEAIWPIGSGDVFTAVVAAEWAGLGRPLRDATRLASAAVARYVEHPRALPVDSGALQPGQLTPWMPSTNPRGGLVYLAGPFFSLPSRWLVHQTRHALMTLGAEVFSPFHDVGLGDADDVAPADLAALKGCNVVLALLDGLDAGTLFEVGYARSLKIPVIALAQNEPDDRLKMVLGSGCQVFSDFSTAVHRAALVAAGFG